MNREIKFRGKRKDNGEFIIGDLAKMWNGLPFIMPNCFFATKDLGYDEDDPEEVKKMLDSVELALGGFIEVTPESVGQFTRLYDKNGKEIYEGDILDFGNKNYVPVVFDNGCFNVFDEPLGWDFDSEEIPFKTNFNYCEIVGNICENPELLSAGEK